VGALVAFLNPFLSYMNDGALGAHFFLIAQVAHDMLPGFLAGRRSPPEKAIEEVQLRRV